MIFDINSSLFIFIVRLLKIKHVINQNYIYNFPYTKYPVVRVNATIIIIEDVMWVLPLSRCVKKKVIVCFVENVIKRTLFCQ